MSSSPPRHAAHGALRRLRDEDAEEVAALFAEAFGEARSLDAEEIRTWLRNPELERDLLRVLEVEGRVAGYGDLWIETDMVELDVAAPGHWDAFLDWAEETARERAVPFVRAFFPDGHELAGVVAARGYRLARTSATMEVELDEAPPPAELPDGVVVRRYRESLDETVVREAINEAFAEEWRFSPVSEGNFREFYLRSRGFDPALWLLAWTREEPAGDELAGFALAYPERVGDTGLGWIGTLGVRPAWRRRGLGEALLRGAFAALYDRGLRRVGLGVDVENVTGALRLYERVGMRVVRRAGNWVRELPATHHATGPGGRGV